MATLCGMNANTLNAQGEIRDYVRSELIRRRDVALQRCGAHLGRMRGTKEVYFALYTALDLCETERPRCPQLPPAPFHMVTRVRSQRSAISDTKVHVWNHDFLVARFSGGVACTSPVDTWVQFAQFLEVDELVTLLESTRRRWGYTAEQINERIMRSGRFPGKRRCLAALTLMRESDSVQESRCRLTLLRFGLPEPRTRYAIEDTDERRSYTVDMAYPEHKVAIEYDGDHHRRFRDQYVRDRTKRRRLRQMGWTVIEVFADDLWRQESRRQFIQDVATALHTTCSGMPLAEYQDALSPKLALNARKNERQRLALQRERRVYELRLRSATS